MSDSTNNAPTLHWHGLQPFVTFTPPASWPWDAAPTTSLTVRANNELTIRAAIAAGAVEVKP